MKKMTLFLIGLLTAMTALAQDVRVVGTVTSAQDNEPLPGASVLVKGTQLGESTDLDGRFSIKAPVGGTLIVSYIGFLPKEITVKADMTDLNIVLSENSQTLDDVVVVGYGVQKKSVVTASIARISSDDLGQVNPVRVDDALKGLAAGINVTSNNGQPGAGSTIRVRGIGTINNSDPLYIVDGMPVDDGIGFLDPNDIASIEVLKDAASGAVYGARAANGVILVTTKKGGGERVSVNYNFSYGWQNPWRKRSVLNATEYAVMMNEMQLNNGSAPIYSDPYSFGAGTDWQDLVFDKNAPVMNHQLSISGSSQKVDYYFSASYFTQDGIIGGSMDRSNYDRLSIRSNNIAHLFDVTKERSWLSKLDFTSNMTFTHENSRGIDTNSEFGSILGSAVALSPILTPYYNTPEEEAAALKQYGKIEGFTPVYSPDGRLYTIPGSAYNEMANPLARMSLPNAKNWTDKLYGNWSAELTIWDTLKFRSNFGLELAWYGDDGWTPKYWLNTAGHQATFSSVYSNMNKRTNWQIENTLYWDRHFGQHYVSVLLGQSASKATGRSLGASGQDMLMESDDKASIDATTGTQADGKRGGSGGVWNPHTLSSLFGRVSYNFDERYMLQFIMRRDGSSNFGANKRYGTFPSVSVGWNVTNEPLLRDKLPTWFNNTKVRFSWGRNGNENIGSFGYISLTATGNNYPFGAGAGQAIVPGVKPAQIVNADLHWEESEQTDVGIDFALLNNSLTFTVDYFYKKTKGMLIQMPLAGFVGEVAPMGNVGTMSNRGVEFELGYRWKVGDWNFRVTGNASWLQNRLINLGNASGFRTVESVQGLGEIVRGTNGMPYPYFYGYQTAGVFQNYDEIRSYVNADGEMIQPNAVPGDVRWVDRNGDGKIDGDDQGMIGCGTPDWTYGFSINVQWKGFDLSAVCQGTAGNDIYDASRRNDITSANLPRWMLNRWTGEGTSDRYPRVSANDQTNWARSSDLYITDGSYFRLKNITLGYTLPSKLTRKFFVQNLRVFVMGENLLTATKYAGFDPEVTNGSSLGVDRGVYPQSKVWTIGCNVSF